MHFWKMQVAAYLCEGFGVMVLTCKTKTCS